MQIGYVQLMEEVVCFAEVFVRFGGEADDDVDAYAAMRHKLSDECYFFCIEFAAISAAHLAEDIVTAAL